VGVFLGLLLIFNNIAGWLFTYTLQPFPTPFGAGAPILGGIDLIHGLPGLVHRSQQWRFRRSRRHDLCGRSGSAGAQQTGQQADSHKVRP
jgi:hypothetical protein